MLIDVHDSGPGLQRKRSPPRCSSPRSPSRSTDGARPLDRQEERAAVGRRRHGDSRGARWRCVQGVAAVMTRKRHIVIVDDEANIGRSLRLILEGEGYRVSVFDSTTAFAAERSRGRRRASARRAAARRQRHRLAAAGAAVGRTFAAVMISGTARWPTPSKRRGSARSTSSRSRSRATACCWSSRTRSSGRTCSARTSATANWSGTRRG